MTKELTYEQETVRSVFGAYINDLKAYSSKPDRSTFRKLEEVRDMAIKALEQQPKPMEKFDDVKTHIQRLAGDYKCWDNRLTWEEALELNRMLEAQPSDDCISRQAAINTAISAADDWDGGCDAYREEMIREALEALPSVTPTNEDIKESYLKGYDYGVKD